MTSVFGPLVTPTTVKSRVLATLRDWMPTYVAEVERQNELEPQRLELPRSYVYRGEEIDKSPEDALPAVIVSTPGTSDDPTPDEDGFYQAPWVVNVAVVASAKDQDSTEVLVGYYAAAVRGILVHNQSLGGFANGVTWKGERYEDLDPDGHRSIHAAIVTCEAQMLDVVQRGAGLNEPPADPYEPSEYLTVLEAETTLEKEPIDG